MSHSQFTYCLFCIKNKLLFKHMPILCMWMLCECYQIWTVACPCVQTTRICVYAQGHVHRCTHQCVQRHIMKCLLSTVGLFLYYHTIHHCTILEENVYQSSTCLFHLHTVLFFSFTSNRITWYLWKDSGFQTACQSPRKFVVSLSYDSPAPFGRGTRMTNGNLRRNPLSFLPLFCLFSCTQTELF